MSQSWNGLDLQTELSAALSDSSTAFKAKVLGWMNDIALDITARHDWPNLRKKGKKVLTSAAEEQNLHMGTPSAPTVAIAAGGSLVDGTSYKVLVTFVDSNGLESIAGTASSAATGTAANKTIDVTAIPVSSDPLVSSRKLYVSKTTSGVYGNYLFDQTISDNTTTTATITSETTSTIEPPDYHGIKKIEGDPFFESSPKKVLIYKPIEQIRLLNHGEISSGTPNFWCDLGNDRVLLSPNPSSALTLSFYYYQRPRRLFAEATNQPDLIPELKRALVSGVIWKGYEYRDRPGQESKLTNYENELSLAISRYGDATTQNPRVRDIYGDSDGWEN